MIKKYLKYVLLIIAALWVFSNKAYATEYLNSVSKDLSTFMSNSKLENYQMDTINFTKEENKSKESTVITNNVQGVSDKTARIVFRSDKVKGITEKEINSWLGVLLDLRSELTQITTKDFDNGNVDIIATNYYNPAVAYVIAGRTEIQWMTNYVDLTSLHNDFQSGANTPFFITHEMGHQHTSETCNFDSEF